MNAKLHYIFDPLCGWCYGASQLLTTIQNRIGDQLTLVFQPGLLFPKPYEIGPRFRERFINADLLIGSITGIEFGVAYINRVRTAPVLCYHSQLPASAVLATNLLKPSRGLCMLKLIQQAHYQQGDDVNDATILIQFAEALGLTAKDFAQALENMQYSLPGMAINARHLMRAVGANGFPTLILEQNGELQKLDHSSAYGKPDLLVNRIAALIAG